MGLLEKLGLAGDEPRVECAECGEQSYVSMTQMWVVGGQPVVVCENCGPKMRRRAA